MSVHEETRRSSRDIIVEAGEYLMARYGYGETSITQICTRSNLPVGSVYHHFGSKIGILRAVVSDGSDRLIAKLETAQPTSTDEAGLEHFFDTATDVLLDEMQYLRLTMMVNLEVVNDNEIRMVLAQQGARAEESVSGAIKPYITARGVSDAEQFSDEVASIVLSIARGRIVDLQYTPERFRRALRGCVDMIRILVDDRLKASST